MPVFERLDKHLSLSLSLTLPGYSSWGQISAELTHGSLASMASTGVFFQDGLTDNAWGDRADYTAPPRAFESELGLRAPVGFLDPAGFTADGSVENFQRRRQMVLQHGRPGPLRRSAPVAAASEASVMHAPAAFADEIGDAANKLGDASCDFAKEVDWNNGVFLQAPAKLQPLEALKTADKMHEMGAAAGPTPLKDVA